MTSAASVFSVALDHWRQDFSVAITEALTPERSWLICKYVYINAADIYGHIGQHYYYYFVLI